MRKDRLIDLTEKKAFRVALHFPDCVFHSFLVFKTPLGVIFRDKEREVLSRNRKVLTLFKQGFSNLDELRFTL